MTNASRIDFTGAHISFVSRGKLPWDSEVPVRLRAFRKIAEETKNHDLERDLYIEERKAEHGVYGALANYGRSFVRPTLWLVLSVWLFHWGYASILAALKQRSGPVNAGQYEQAVWILARGNAVPFVGPLTIDAGVKKFLFCAGDDCSTHPPIPPDGFQWLVIAQNLVSIALFFFIGLALRNYFKIK